MLDQLVRIIPVTIIKDDRGGLGVVELAQVCGFSASRFYFLYDVRKPRGGHAHRRLRQCFIALAGRAEITVDSGRERRTIVLDSPERALIVNPMVWRDLDMTPDTVLGVLASEPYDEAEYIRHYETFTALALEENRK